jgi:hypothetical protein
MPAADIIMSRPCPAQPVLQSVRALHAKTVRRALHNFHDAGRAGTLFAILTAEIKPGASRTASQPNRIKNQLTGVFHERDRTQ